MNNKLVEKSVSNIKNHYMRKLLLVSLLFSNLCFGQNKELKCTTKYYDAVDKWVAFDKTAGDSTYMLGFIYIDEEAGFTFNYESRFVIMNNSLKKLPSILAANETGLKVRLSRNAANVAVLSDEEVEQLGLPEVPGWLKHYKANENENSYLVKIGYLYNGVGASHNAIEPLLKVYEKEPHFQGLEFELAYAYNATRNFDKAITVLNKAIENNPKNFGYYRELGFAFKNQNKLDDAEKAYLQGIKLSADKSQKAEMAVNMAQSYFQVKNKPKFKEWAKLTKKYADKNSQFLQYIKYWEENWDK